MGNSQIRDYLLSPGTQVFGGDPERGSSSGTIPPDTEIRVRVSGFPTKREIYSSGCVREVKCVDTDPRYIVGPENVSAGGFILYPGEIIYFSADLIRNYTPTALPR